MWEIIYPDDDAYLANVERLRRKHRTEVTEAFKRLKTLWQYLNSEMPLRDALGQKWVHHKYRRGMKSLAGGGRKGQATLRLYIYPDAEHQIIVALGIGDKSTQEKDVKKAEAALVDYLAEGE